MPSLSLTLLSHRLDTRAEGVVALRDLGQDAGFRTEVVGLDPSPERTVQEVMKRTGPQLLVVCETSRLAVRTRLAINRQIISHAHPHQWLVIVGFKDGIALAWDDIVRAVIKLVQCSLGLARAASVPEQGQYDSVSPGSP